MRVNLVVARGKRKGHIVPIHVGQFVIGRHKECHLKANGATISQHHCAVLVRDGKVFIRDFDSTNGTYVNQNRVRGEQELAAGDVLELGRLAFLVRIDADTEEAPPPPMKADDSMVAAMLLGPSDSTDSQGILGLMDDSKCGSTIMQNPFAEEESSQKTEPTPAPEKTPPPENAEPKGRRGDPLPPASQNEEIAKKILDQFHRSVRAKHNRPEEP
jgi:predicted component of type VI protein secretion system